MKKLFLLLLVPFLVQQARSQCFGGTPEALITPSSSWQTYAGITAGEYLTFYATTGVSYQFSFCASDGGVVSFDPQITLLSLGGNPLAYNDDYCGLESNVVWTANMTDSVRVLVSEYYCNVNSIGTTIAYRILPPNPQDSICDAVPLTVDALPVNADNLGATADLLALPSCWSDFSVDNDIWFSFVAPPQGDVAIETFYVGGISTQIALYQANPSGNCTGTLTEINCNEYGGNMSLIAAFGLNPGETYFVRVDGQYAAMGTFQIQVRTIIPPANDSICDATALIVDNPFIAADNSYASPDASPPLPSCFTSDGTLDNDIWFSFVAPASGNVAVETTYGGGLFNSQLALYESSPSGSCTGSLTEIGCNEYGGFMSQIVALGLTPGETYFVRMDGMYGDMGIFNIRVRSVVPPPNDSICNAEMLTVDAPPVTSTNEFGGIETGLAVPSCFNDVSVEHTVWFSFVAPATGNVEIETFYNFGIGSTQIALYDGANCNATLTELACNEFGGSLSLITAGGLTPGTTYYVMVDGYFGDQGTFDIQVREIPPPCPLSFPAGVTAESEQCGSDNNGGCNSFPSLFQAITCGQAIRGTITNVNFSPNEDWYRFSVTNADSVRIVAETQFYMNFYVIDVDDCNNPLIQYFGTVQPCDSIQYTGFLQPGSYAIMIAPDFFPEVPCGYGNEYWVSLQIGEPLPQPEITDPGTLCSNGGDITLSTVPVYTGTWNGAGVINNNQGIYSPSTAGAGTYTVHFQSTPNANGCKAKDSIVLTVIDPPVADFDVNINGNTVTVTDMSSGVNSYSWNFGDGGVSSQVNPSHTYAQNGIYNIVLIASNLCGVSVYNQIVNIGNVSVDEYDVNALKVFPNPVSDVLYITAQEAVSVPVNIHITDLAGRKLLSMNEVSLPAQVPVESLPQALYILQVEIGGQVIPYRFIKL